ncbi:MAG TPA: hydantoinase/oxoprolinase N-terminal domain-containing protein, partial [Gaiellales bacterium]
LAHGSTVATNAIVQRRLARTGLITNDGFRDVLTIGTQMRRHVYDLWAPDPIGRIGPQGEEVEPLDDGGVRRAAQALRAADVDAVAVMLLFSFANPAHEHRVGAILAEELPGVPLSLSSLVVPEYREYVRASTTAVNVSLLPLLGEYIGALRDRVAGEGISVPVHLMQANGGVTPAERARELPM